MLGTNNALLKIFAATEKVVLLTKGSEWGYIVKPTDTSNNEKPDKSSHQSNT